MGRAPCCDKANVKKGPWSPEEDAKLKDFMEKFGTVGNWIALPQKAGLKRCGKSCRLRWLNYLRPNIKHGEFTEEEDRIICSLYATIGSRWSIIASQLQGRTDNDIKNYWNTKLKKKLLGSTTTNLNKRNHNQQQLQYQQLHQQQLHFPPLQFPQSNRAFDQFNTLNPSSLLQSPSYLHYDVKPSLDDGNMIMFGSEKSCTSSDNMASLESYLYNSGTGENQNLNIVKEGGGSCGMFWGEAPLEYNYEEIKQLLNCNYTLCNTSSVSNSTTPSSSVILPDDPVEGLKPRGKMYQF